MPQVFNFGRLFFPDKKPIPDEVRFQPLGNHVGNAIELVRYWKKDDFPAPESFDRVIEAAKIHDMGKPKHFAIQSKPNNKGEFKEYIYSFKGHRFDARSKDTWAEKLAIGHHDFSVKDITRDTYALKKDPKYQHILAQDPLAYARELYILEMCDQIEAELACRVLGDDAQAESRAFMDFTIAKQDDDDIYLIDPWPFTESLISMTFRHWSMNPRDIDLDEELQQCIDGENSKQVADLGKTLDRLAKKWWRSLEKTPQEAEPRTISLQAYPSNKHDRSWTAAEFYDRLAGFKPNSMQSKLFDAIYDPEDTKHPAILLKGDTGTGKTESILFPALASGYRIFFPLPARSLLEDQKQRIEQYLKKFSQLYPGREFSMVVDTGSQMHRWIYQNGVEVNRTINARRHLYKGDVILTTIDKFLYRYFAFGDKQKSFTFPLRINQERSLICFDEAHSYDDISFTNFQSLVRSLYEAGRSLVLMTATMPQQLAEYFDYLEVFDFTGISKPHQRSFEWLNTVPCVREDTEGQKDYREFQKKSTQIILAEQQARHNGRILVVIETVRDAAAIYQNLKEQIGGNADRSGRFLFLYHGRIDEGIRLDIYQAIKNRDDLQQPYIVVTTSAIEVGCDLNAEVLISQICPPENLIQRVGRCNRRGDVTNAKVIVIGDRIPEFANSLDESGWQHYQETLQSLNKFDSQAIADCIFQKQHIDDYRVVELFSMLHDYVYGADLTCQPVHEKGLIPTRSWTPSVTLKFHGNPKNSTEQVKHSISVPIDRLCSRENQFAFVCVNERRYDKETSKWNDNYPLGWGSAYNKDIIISISNSLSDFILDATLPEYSYDPELGFVDLPSIFIKLKTNGSEEKLLYQYTDKSQQKKSAIVTYTKSLDK
ncbi:CRISPR-associated helicase Cas3' [Chamaesiphon sp. VAR_48_metabat_403]|uniref:CRISPR-associated helicase Cas3' n=1 Tax=Chamaesiphon sp. VAR_48_metabat_403 TaxID=2964700 RepID=UPI00286DFB76|nr:CRISPR-associated helicase Cas3' [Chamaesiphon sp. VAR_48_metabat_403]